MNESEKTCPCGLCGKPTRMLGTKRCDPCWELERRIRHDPEVVATILAANSDLSRDIYEALRAKRLRIHQEGQVELWMEGAVYSLGPDQQVKVDGSAVDARRAAPRLMARLCLIRAALQTAETSLL